MAPKRIAIIGGGMAALTAAYYLSATPELRERYRITVHQMGWRLGGKCASGRDERGRIVEHGLHAWFGCYANAFALMRRVYAEWNRAPLPRPRLDQIFLPRNRSRVGTFAAGRAGWREVRWPVLPGRPWDENAQWSLQPWAIVAALIGHLRQVLAAEAGPAEADIPASMRLSDASLADFARHCARADGRAGPAAGRQSVGAYLDLAEGMARANAEAPLAGRMARTEAVRDLVEAACGGAGRQELPAGRALMADEFLDDTAQVLRAYLLGVIDDLLLGRESLDTLDRLEFRQWLVRHGAPRATVERSTAVRALYDTMFQYVDGDPARASYAAGTALQVVARLVATYRGSMLYLVGRGTGEVVVGPLYDVLVDNGVRFSFFDKAVSLEADTDGKRVRSIRFHRQAGLRDGTYRPVTRVDGFPCWPAQPDWDQLVDGARLKDEGVDFESHWNGEPPHSEFTLVRGTDFDDVLLAVSLGAMKSFGRPGGLVESLERASAPFRDMVEGFELVPSMAVQLWSDRTSAELGQEGPPHAAVSGPEPFDIHADMSHLVGHEGWPPAERPASLHYLCSVYHSRMYREPPDAAVPAAALREVEDLFADWLAGHGRHVWPGAVKEDGSLDGALVRELHLEPNVDPTDCCPSSAAGTTRLRMAAGETGFENLHFAGCWTRTGLNTTCVEAAVMSGMQAARAISGWPERVVGEDFLRRPAGGPGLPSLGCLGDLVRRFSPFMHAFGEPSPEDADRRTGRGKG